MVQKTSNSSPPFAFTPLGQAVMESFGEGIVIFDAQGRMLYANQRARRAMDELGDPSPGGGGLRDRLAALGGRVQPLKQGSTELGEAVFLPVGDPSRTLAERERQAILETLDTTNGK